MGCSGHPSSVDFTSPGSNRFAGRLPREDVGNESADSDLRRPEDHERDEVARVLSSVRHAYGAFIALPTARPAANPAIALGRNLQPLRDMRRTATLRSLVPGKVHTPLSVSHRSGQGSVSGLPPRSCGPGAS